ncbi:conserved hypothetical protein [Nostocoides japonicum T1-X7]|uniref:Uncharacterized protein n=1 Tax=Nostocoides japonicum T1-X7 TaxID=1194083 RepID=A0A077LU03_9MICO|nr:GNAT family N-acetyltransferase [Tetrasphaera japonica]CCH76022.1 conserved hypothetical protein [Tetrasphaera japonica T1-X7]
MSEPARPEITVTREDDEHRYAARVDGALAGFVAYDLDGDAVALTHTEVDPAFEGKGVGGALARAALDDIRSGGDRRVVPVCPFIKAWIARHPDYEELVVSS